MTWEKPEVFEIKMDAEIGSYQLDDEGPHFVKTTLQTTRGETAANDFGSDGTDRD
jgi:hypothetical protein